MLVQVITRMTEKLTVVLENSFGWMLSAVMVIINFISPEKYSFIAMGIAIVFDLLFGMYAAKKQGKFFISSVFRETPAKVFIYGGFLLVVFCSEKLFASDFFLVTRVCSGLGCACEIWSMLGSALIIKPDMLFPKVLKLQLKGEIDAKFGKNIGDQFNDKEKEDEIK